MRVFVDDAHVQTSSLNASSPLLCDRFASANCVGFRHSVVPLTGPCNRAHLLITTKLRGKVPRIVWMDLQTRRDARSLDHGTLEEMRRLAVRRVKAGESQRSVAESLEVHPRTVSKWIVAEGSRGPRLSRAQSRRVARLG